MNNRILFAAIKENQNKVLISLFKLMKCQSRRRGVFSLTIYTKYNHDNKLPEIF